MIVESSTAKKTTSKSWVLPPTPAMTGKVARTTGTAPRSPAPESARRSLHVNRAGRVEMATATGREMNTSTSASTVPRTATSSSRLGKTSRPSETNIATCPTQASPWWKEVTVCWAGMPAVPSASPAR